MKTIFQAPATIAAPTLLIFAGKWIGTDVWLSLTAGGLGLACYMAAIYGALREGRASGVKGLDRG